MDINILLKSLPPRIDDAMKMAYIRKTIENKEIKKSMETCKDLNEMLTLMANRHVDDKGLINNIFKPVYSAKYPATYTICYGNIEVVLRCFEILKTVGVTSRVEMKDYDECLTKALHPKRETIWTDKVVMLDIEGAEVPVDPLNQTELETAGTVDIESMIRRRNTQRSVEDMINALHE